MKTLSTTTALRILLLLAAFLPFTKANAHDFDFEIGDFQYIVTSDTTVKISGMLSWGNWEPWDFSSLDFKYIEIPSYVSFNDVDYAVTAIGDSAFYCNPLDLPGCRETGICCDITLPETISSIGNNAFGGYFDLLNIICFSKTPPIIDNNFSLDNNRGHINLFITEDAYPLYVEEYNQNHYFDSIYITNGERSDFPKFEDKDLFQPFSGYPYGYTVKIYTNKNKIIFSREFENYGLSDDISYCKTHSIYTNDSIYYYFENNFTCVPAGWKVDLSIIEDGKSPNYMSFGNLFGGQKGGSFYPKWTENFSFMDSGISYYIMDDGIGVTNTSYTNYCGDGETKTKYYSGDVVIPSTAIYHDYQNDTYATYQVRNICCEAFRNCVNLTSIDIPNSISCSHSEAFAGCTGLTRVNISDLAAWCNIYFDSFSNPLYYAHHLYLNGSEVTDLVIPNTVSMINQCVFEGCYGLSSVTIPSSVTTIELDAFKDCSNISFVKCLAKIPANVNNWGEDYWTVFDECVYQNATLYVPMDAVDAYKNAEGWKLFQHIVGFYDYDYEVDGVYYMKTSDNEVTVVQGDNPYQGVVSIPETVTYEGVTYNVTGISSGAFADATLQSLILPVSIASVEDGAFDGCHINSLIITGNGSWTAGAIAGEIDNLYVMSTVTGIEGLQVNPTTIYSYSNVPSTCNDNTFTGYDGALHVHASSLAAYFTAPYWSNFINIVGDAVEPTGIKLNNDSVEVLVGNQLSLNATITPSNAVPRDVIWTTSDESIATVNDGAITALKAGECDIKAYLLDKTAICHVTVTEIAPTEVTLNQEFAKLEIGSQLTLTATVLPDNATDKQVTWSTTNSAVATVDSLGHVTAVGEGECFITATCRDKQAMCLVIVVDHFIFITLDEHDVRLLPNHMMTLTPTVSPANTTLVVTSSDPTVAAARMANGNIQLVGIKEGTTVITVNSTDGYAEADSCLVKVYTLRGDVNSDGFINISDVTVLINYLLSGSAEGINIINADANNDGKITISDVSVLISSLLSGEPLAPKEEPIG